MYYKGREGGNYNLLELWKTSQLARQLVNVTLDLN